MADTFEIIESKKYMWDGVVYETEALAAETKGKYERRGFDTVLLQDEGKFLLYTRKVSEASPTPAP